MGDNHNVFSTPIRNKEKEKLIIPPSPFLKKLGFGTGVCVYEFARSPVADKLRSPWAIKKLMKKSLKNEELKKRLYSEADILRKLNHPNIVGFRAFVESSQGDVLAMEECTSSLGDMIEAKRDNGEVEPYPVDIILRVGKDISSALNYLHNIALILHCDVKSFNILVKEDFKISKLCDFGVCLPLKKDGTVDETKIDEEFEYTGSLAWCAPEVMKYPPIITTKADVYAFGLVLYEMVSLSLPVNEDMVESMDISSNEEGNPLNFSMFENNQFLLPNLDLDDDYDEILELMYMCTVKNAIERPEFAVLEKLFSSLFSESLNKTDKC